MQCGLHINSLGFVQGSGCLRTQGKSAKALGHQEQSYYLPGLGVWAMMLTWQIDSLMLGWCLAMEHWWFSALLVWPEHLMFQG